MSKSAQCSKFVFLLVGFCLFGTSALAVMSPVITSTPQQLLKAGGQLSGACTTATVLVANCNKCAAAIKKSADTMEGFLAKAVAADQAAEASTMTALGGASVTGSLFQRALQAGALDANGAAVKGLEAQMMQRKYVVASSEACKTDLDTGGCEAMLAFPGAKDAYTACSNMGTMATGEMGQIQTAGARGLGNVGVAGTAVGQSGLSGILGTALGIAAAGLPIALALMKKDEGKQNSRAPPALAQSPANTVTADPTKISSLPVNPSFSSGTGGHAGASIDSTGKFDRGKFSDSAAGNGSGGNGSGSGGAFNGALSKTDGGGGGGSLGAGSGGIPISVKEKDKAYEDVRALDIGGNAKGPGVGAGSTSILGVNSKGNELEPLVEGGPRPGAEGENAESALSALQLPGFDELGANGASMSPIIAAAMMAKDPSSIFRQVHTKIIDVARRGSL